MSYMKLVNEKLINISINAFFSKETGKDFV